MMHVLAISDLHGHLPEIPKCDLLLLGGDYNKTRNRDEQLKFMKGEFKDWLHSIEARYIVGIAGNHDFVMQEWPELLKDLPWIYLQDTTIDLEGIKIHGTPYTPTFGNWAFMKNDYKLKEHFEKIPSGLDILLSHGPAVMRLDRTREGYNAGSPSLRTRIELVKPDSVVCGHIHEAHGVYDDGTIRYYNVAHCNLHNEPVHEPVAIPLRAEK